MANGADDTLKKLRETTPPDYPAYLSLVAEVVEARMAKRRQALFYKRLTIVVTVIMGVLALALPQGDKYLKKWVTKQNEKQNVVIAKARERSGEIPTPLSPTARTPIPLEPTSTDLDPNADSKLNPKSASRVALKTNESWNFSITVQEGVYEIDTKGLEQFDPVIKLFRIENSELHLVASNDDVEEGTKDAGLTIKLEGGTDYQLEVRELLGNPGAAEVYLRKMNQ